MTKYYVNNTKVEILKDALKAAKRNMKNSKEEKYKNFFGEKVNKLNTMIERLEPTTKSNVTSYRNMKDIENFIKETYL